MMKGERSMATAVRAPGGEITIESKRIKSPKERNVFFRLPFVRGVVNLFTQLVQGTGIIMRSAEVYGEFSEPSKAEKDVAKKLKVDPMKILMTFSVLLGVVLAVALFVFLPNLLSSLICDHTAIHGSRLESLWYSLIEGGFMLTIFVCYILAVTLMKDVRRVFMYHGAEHKTINCFEHGLELTVENAKTMKRVHSRCGTTFLFFVISVSIIVFVLVNFMLSECGLLVADGVSGAKILNALIKLGFKLLFLPVVAGFSYELLKLLAKSDCLFVRILRAPGMALQLLTTKEPTDDMLEVAIAAFKRVQAMDADPTMPETKFEVSLPYDMASERLKEVAPTLDESDVDWILVEASRLKRSELKSARFSKEQFEYALGVAAKMKGGMPLQYALEYTEFYGLRLNLNRCVLIPRPETEEVAKTAIEIVKSLPVLQNCDEQAAKYVPHVLDMCTGSGAIALAVKRFAGASVVASDISAQAVDVAKANALTLGLDVDFRVGDMWQAVGQERFDVVVSNPPYIPSGDISALDKKVKDFEPLSALDGGADGLKFYRILHDGLASHLNDGGCLVAEIGIGQAESIRDIFADFDVEIFKDVEGVERIAVVRSK